MHFFQRLSLLLNVCLVVIAGENVTLIDSGWCMLPKQDHANFVYSGTNLEPTLFAKNQAIVTMVCSQGFRTIGNSKSLCENSKWELNFGSCVKVGFNKKKTLIHFSLRYM